jgi:hypothetical protein
VVFSSGTRSTWTSRQTVGVRQIPRNRLPQRQALNAPRSVLPNCQLPNAEPVLKFRSTAIKIYSHGNVIVSYCAPARPQEYAPPSKVGSVEVTTLYDGIWKKPPRIFASKMLVCRAHFAFLGTGSVAKNGSGYAFTPVTG